MYGANVIIFEGIFTFYNVDVLKVSKITYLTSVAGIC